jgi:hypothetical protein
MGLMQKAAPFIGVATILIVFSRILTDTGREYIHIHDDDANYVNNPLLESVSWAGVKNIFSHSAILNVYEPVSLTVKLLLSPLVGRTAQGFQVASLLLHAANALLASRIHAAIAADISPGAPVPSVYPGLVAAVLMACHPLRVEVVAWASCLPYALAALLALLSFHCHMQARACARQDAASLNSSRPGGVAGRSSQRGGGGAGGATGRRLSTLLLSPWAAYKAGELLLFVAACLSKAAAVSLPAFFVCVDAFLDLAAAAAETVPADAAVPPATTNAAGSRSKPSASASASTTPNPAQALLRALLSNALLLAAAGCAARQALLAEAGSTGGHDLQHRLVLTPLQTAVRAGHACFLQVAKLLRPGSLSLGYWAPAENFDVSSLLSPSLSLSQPYAAGFAAALATSAAALAAVSMYRPGLQRSAAAGAAVAAAWAWLALLSLAAPTLGLVSSHVNMVFADRYTYLPALLVATPLLAGALASLAALTGRVLAHSSVYLTFYIFPSTPQRPLLPPPPPTHTHTLTHLQAPPHTSAPPAQGMWAA